MIKILALIPARSGSKSLPNKNILPFHGLPMIAHSIQVAKASKYSMRVVVSTDSEHYAEIARQHGAETPFLRPIEMASDLSTDLACFQHALATLKGQNGYQPDIIVHLRPTYPLRTAKLLDDCIDKFIDKMASGYTSLRTVIPVEKTPFKMYTVDGEELCPLFPTYGELREPYNCARQALPRCYLHNGCIDVVATETVTRHNSVTGPKIFAYLMPSDECHDIDTSEDLEKAAGIA